MLKWMGLLSLWNEVKFKVIDCISNSRCLILIGELLQLKKKVEFCNVYASSLDKERLELWNFIISSMNLFPIPWCIWVDFNAVLDPSEMIGLC